MLLPLKLQGDSSTSNIFIGGWLFKPNYSQSLYGMVDSREAMVYSLFFFIRERLNPVGQRRISNILPFMALYII